MSSAPDPKFRVAISGGGVGGLVCAAALARFPDIHVDVYEAHAAFTDIGAGIGIWPRAWAVLTALGLADAIVSAATSPPTTQPQTSFMFRKGDQQPEGVTFYELVTPGGLTTFHRPQMHRLLLGVLPPGRTTTHTRKRLVSYTQSEPTTPPDGSAPVSLLFEDGTTATCDVLIGADGVKSATRRALVRERRGAHEKEAEAGVGAEDGAPRWTGTCAYRVVIPAERLRAVCPGHRIFDHQHVYFGKNTQVTAYPVAQGKLINFAAFRAQYEREGERFPGKHVQEVSVEELAEDFAGWEPEVQAMIKCIDKPSRWAVHVVPPMESWVSGNVALLGDAAHAAMPYQGMGAGQAIEDAYVLSALLGSRHTTRATLRRALSIYDAVRRPLAARVAAQSDFCGRVYTFNEPRLAFDGRAVPGDAEHMRRLDAAREAIVDTWDWVWSTSADGDVERAVGMLADAAAREAEA